MMDFFKDWRCGCKALESNEIETALYLWSKIELYKPPFDQAYKKS